jgi:hypothetical protein
MPRAHHLVMSLLLSFFGLAGPPAPVTYRPPVTAPIVDPFRPPSTPYGRGNRGLEYGTEPGDPVRAAAPGLVTFAGAVGGRLFVTVLHDDRVRTTYGRLRSIAVGTGEVVEAGQVVGAAGDGLLFTARLGTAYVDPAVLLAASGHAPVRLVPDDRAVAEQRPGGGPRPVPLAAAEWAFRTGLGAVPVGVTMLARRPGDRPASHQPHRPWPTHGRDLESCLVRESQPMGRKGHGPRCHDEAAAGRRRPFRAPDPSMEPEDEAIHLR